MWYDLPKSTHIANAAALLKFVAGFYKVKPMDKEAALFDSLFYELRQSETITRLVTATASNA